MPRVAVDAMGGDHAPQEVVAGAVAAAGDGLDVVLVGRPAALAAAGAGDMAVVEAADVIGMDEDPALALRRKPDCSVRRAASLVAAGEADALVSAGSTGATVAAALLELGRIPGVRRPVIAAPLPVAGGERGHVLLVDAGAAPDVQPAALVGSARMAVALAKAQGIDHPRVGLLNVGEEPGKGNELARESYELLAAEDWFSGNVEPSAVRAGVVDVVVTDGFTGNILLKTVEAWAETAVRQSPGAAVLLGVPAPVLVAHGAAKRDDIRAAVRTASAAAAGRLADRVAERLNPQPARVRVHDREEVT